MPNNVDGNVPLISESDKELTGETPVPADDLQRSRPFRSECYATQGYAAAEYAFLQRS